MKNQSKIVTDNLEKKKFNTLNFFKRICFDEKLRANLMFVLFIRLIFTYFSIGSNLELEAISKNVYSNLITFCLLECSACILISLILKKDNLVFLTKASCIICFISLSIFFFKSDKKSKSQFKNIFYFILVLISKIGAEILISLTYIINLQLFPPEMINFALGICSLISQILLAFVPYVNYFCKEYLKVHPFFIYSLIFLYCAYISNSITFIFKNYDLNEKLALDNSIEMQIKKRSEEILACESDKVKINNN